MTFDQILTRPNLCLVYYLMSSFLYYKLDLSVLTDYEYDTLAMKLIEKWDEVDHPHKGLVNIEDLKAGTGPRSLRVHEKHCRQWYGVLRGGEY